MALPTNIYALEYCHLKHIETLVPNRNGTKPDKSDKLVLDELPHGNLKSLVPFGNDCRSKPTL